MCGPGTAVTVCAGGGGSVYARHVAGVITARQAAKPGGGTRWKRQACRWYGGEKNKKPERKPQQQAAEEPRVNRSTRWRVNRTRQAGRKGSAAGRRNQN